MACRTCCEFLVEQMPPIRALWHDSGFHFWPALDPMLLDRRLVVRGHVVLRSCRSRCSFLTKASPQNWQWHFSLWSLLMCSLRSLAVLILAGHLLQVYWHSSFFMPSGVFRLWDSCPVEGARNFGYSYFLRLKLHSKSIMAHLQSLCSIDCLDFVNEWPSWPWQLTVLIFFTAEDFVTMPACITEAPGFVAKNTLWLCQYLYPCVLVQTCSDILIGVLCISP